MLMLTFLATTSGGKLCLEMTHNALVHVFLSVDLTTREQSADSISAAKVSGKQRKHNHPQQQLHSHTIQSDQVTSEIMRMIYYIKHNI